MPPNDIYNADVLAALVKGLDNLGPESTALLSAAKPAIRNAIERGITSAAIRREINRATGIKLSPEQFRRLLDGSDDEDTEGVPQGVFAQAFAGHPKKQASSGSAPPDSPHPANETVHR